MALAQVSNQLLRSQGSEGVTVDTNYPITGDGSHELPLGLAEDYRGADGTSVTFNISAIPSGHRVTLSGAQGQESFDVMNGETGPSGAQGETGPQGPEGPQGPSGSQGPAGQDGVDGVSPTFRFSEDETGVTVYVSGAQGEDSFRLYNGTSGNTYSAGPNIDIYPVEDQLYISGTDWTNTIESAVSSKMDKSESGNFYPMVGNPSGFLTAVDLSNYYQKTETSSKEEISAALADKLDKSESGNFYPMTGNPSGFLTAHQSLTNLDYVQNSALGYTPSMYISSISGHELYAESANHAFEAETANFVTGGWEYDDNNNISSYNGSAFVGQNQATYDVKAGANINVATADNTFTVSGKDWTDEITAASAYAASLDKTYTGVAPIVVNNTQNKISADCIELSAGKGIDSNKLATGVIEVSADIIEYSAGNGIDSDKLALGIIEVSSQGGAGGLTVCAWNSVTNNPQAFYTEITASPYSYAISDGSRIAYYKGVDTINDTQTLNFSTAYKFAFDDNNTETDVYNVSYKTSMFGNTYTATTAALRNTDVTAIKYSDLLNDNSTKLNYGLTFRDKCEKYIISLYGDNEGAGQNYGTSAIQCRLASVSGYFGGISYFSAVYTGYDETRNKMCTVSAVWPDLNNKVVFTSAEKDLAGGGGVAISGQYKSNDETVTKDCSAFGMFEQANSQGSYQLMATAKNDIWHSYGYTMSTPENVLMNNVSAAAQAYAASAVSSHIVPMAYSDITYSAVRDVIFNKGIVIPYETNQGYGTFYDFVASAVADSTSSFTFRNVQTNGYCTTLVVSSYNYGATTGKVKNQSRIFLSPAECECKVVLVAASGDIPASGATDGKLYVVTGSGT